MCALVLATALSSAAARAQTCTPDVGSESRGRVQMTHRPAAPRRTLIATTGVTTMTVWTAPPSLSDQAQRERDEPIDPFEERAFTLTGDIWRVRYDEACNLQLEVSAAGQRARDARIIATIPVGAVYESARAAVLAQIPPGGPTGTPGTNVFAGGARRALDLTTPLRVTLTGYGYFDTAHWSPSRGVRGVLHGSPRVATLWELRPVWRAEFPVRCAPNDARCLRLTLQAERAAGH